MADPLKTLIDDSKKKMARKLGYAMDKIPPGSTIATLTIKKYLAGIVKLMMLLSQEILQFQTDAMIQLDDLVLKADKNLENSGKQDSTKDCHDLFVQLTEEYSQLKEEIAKQFKVVLDEKAFLYKGIGQIQIQVKDDVTQVLQEQARLYKKQHAEDYEVYKEFFTKQLKQFSEELKLQQETIAQQLLQSLNAADNSKNQLDSLITKMTQHMKNIEDAGKSLKLSSDLILAETLSLQTQTQNQKEIAEKTISSLSQQAKEVQNFRKNDLVQSKLNFDTQTQKLATTTQKIEDVLKEQSGQIDNKNKTLEKNLTEIDQHRTDLQTKLDFLDQTQKNLSKNIEKYDQTVEILSSLPYRNAIVNIETDISDLKRVANNFTEQASTSIQKLDQVIESKKKTSDDLQTFTNNIANIIQSSGKKIDDDILDSAKIINQNFQKSTDKISEDLSTYQDQISKNFEESSKIVATTLQTQTNKLFDELTEAESNIQKGLNAQVNEVFQNFQTKKEEFVEEINTLNDKLGEIGKDITTKLDKFQPKDATIDQRSIQDINKSIQSNFKVIEESISKQIVAFKNNEDNTITQLQSAKQNFDKQIKQSIEVFNQMQTQLNQTQDNIGLSQQQNTNTILQFVQGIELLKSDYLLISQNADQANTNIQASLSELNNIFSSLQLVIKEINQLKNLLTQIFSENVSQMQGNDEDYEMFQSAKEKLVQIETQIKEKADRHSYMEKIVTASQEDFKKMVQQQTQIAQDIQNQQKQLTELKIQRLSELTDLSRNKEEISTLKNKKDKLNQQILQTQTNIDTMSSNAFKKQRESIEYLQQLASSNIQLQGEKEKADAVVQLYSHNLGKLDVMAQKFKELTQMQSDLEADIQSKKDLIYGQVEQYSELINGFKQLQAKNELEQQRQYMIQEEIIRSKAELDLVKSVVSQQISLKRQLDSIKRSKPAFTKRTIKEIEKTAEQEKKNSEKLQDPNNLSMINQQNNYLQEVEQEYQRLRAKDNNTMQIDTNQYNPRQNNFFYPNNDNSETEEGTFDHDEFSNRGSGLQLVKHTNKDVQIQKKDIFDDFIDDIEVQYNKLKQNGGLTVLAGILVGSISYLVIRQFKEKTKRNNELCFE